MGSKRIYDFDFTTVVHVLDNGYPTYLLQRETHKVFQYPIHISGPNISIAQEMNMHLAIARGNMKVKLFPGHLSVY